MSGDQPRVLVVGGSIRSTGKKDEFLLQLAQDLEGHPDILSGLDREKNRTASGLSNSEILAAIAMRGAVEEGAACDYFSLRRLFPVGDATQTVDSESLGLDEEIFRIDTTAVDRKVLHALMDRARQADCIILCSPVYFGDRSSLLDTFLKTLHQEGALAGKGVAAISVGAKRNGGQETTNVYALFDAINMGAFAIGNGPKTSQYGATGCAGDKGKILEDEFGIETALGTGRRAAQVAQILAHGAGASAELLPKSRIAVLISADNEAREVEATVGRFLAEASTPNVHFETINLLDHRVERCLACKVCPFPPMVENGPRGHYGKTDYACIIDNGRDSVEDLREKLKGMDGLIVVGVNDDRMTDLVDSYQSFTERTRFIRRADFEWMNTPFTSFVLKDVGSTRERIFGLRVMTSYIRHNAIACAPIRALSMGDQLVRSPVPALQAFTEAVARVRLGRDKRGGTRVSYVAGGTGGYADTRLDHTSAVRL